MMIKQTHIPGVGALVDSLFSCLPFLSFINFAFISIVLYSDIAPYLKLHAPWMSLWVFLLFLTALTIIMMVLVYKFVLPSLWTFRGKQMFGYESKVVEKLGDIEKRLGEMEKRLDNIEMGVLNKGDNEQTKL